MRKKTLGEKVRERRKQLKMTQSALSDGFVTRNMISRIETGDINPSLETLRYLAEKLDIPAGYLLTEEDDLLGFLLPRIKETLRQKYREGDYSGAVQLCEEYALCDDETNMILCECAVKLGKSAYEGGDTAGASVWFDRALSYAEQTAYHTEVVLGEAVLCKAMLAEMNGESPETYLTSYAGSLSRAVDLERYLLLMFFYKMEHGEVARASQYASILTMENVLYRMLIVVWQKAAEGQFSEAQEQLAVVLSDEIAKPLERDPVLHYRCIEKMEQLAAAADDFKTAYQYAGKKQQLAQRYHIQHV